MLVGQRVIAADAVLIAVVQIGLVEPVTGRVQDSRGREFPVSKLLTFDEAGIFERKSDRSLASRGRPDSCMTFTA